MTIQKLQNNNELYRQLHQNPNMFMGMSLKTYIPEIGTLIKNSNIQSVNDYGCGKARAWKEYNLKQLWKLVDVGLYDPGVDEYSIPIIVARDLVICIDVLEHIEPDYIDDVLDEINRLSTKAVFLNVCTRPASKILPDGRNAHLIVQPQEWWREKLKRINKLVITHYT
jgi:hypothetical protein